MRHFSDRLALINAYLRGKTQQVPGPSALMVETTVRCNLFCPMCPRTNADYPKEEMPDEILYPLLEEHSAMGGDHVYLYGLGEPLMDPRIFSILDKCHKLGLSTVLSTNGTFLTSARRKKLLESHCDHLLVGIDGATKETYEYYRTGGKFEQVVSNLKALAREKRETNSGLTIVVQFIRMEKNWNEQQAFLDFWSAVDGIDEVRIKDEDIGLPEHRTYEVDGADRRNACHLLWRGPLVARYNGDVYSCYPIAEHGEPLGNLASSTLSDLWESTQITSLRSLHVANRPEQNPHCAQCPAARPRLPFVVGKTVRRLVPRMEKLAHRMPFLFSEPRNRKSR